MQRIVASLLVLGVVVFAGPHGFGKEKIHKKRRIMSQVCATYLKMMLTNDKPLRVFDFSRYVEIFYDRR